MRLFYSTRPRILIDRDDVLGDSAPKIIDALNRVAGTSHTQDDFPKWDIFDSGKFTSEHKTAAWDLLHKEGWPGSVAPIEEAKWAVKELQKLGEVFCVTSCTSAWEGAAWTKEHFGIDRAHYISAHSKWLVDGAVLIDDRPENLVLWTWEHADGLGILWTVPGNRKFDETLHEGIYRPRDWSTLVADVDQFLLSCG